MAQNSQGRSLTFLVLRVEFARICILWRKCYLVLIKILGAKESALDSFLPLTRERKWSHLPLLLCINENILYKLFCKVAVNREQISGKENIHKQIEKTQSTNKDPSISYLVFIIFNVEKVITPRNITLHSVVDHQTRME